MSDPEEYGVVEATYKVTPSKDVSLTVSRTPKAPEDKTFKLIEMLHWYHMKYPNWFKVHKAIETKINNELPG